MSRSADVSELDALAATLSHSFFGLDRKAILAKIRKRKETADQREALAAASGVTRGRVLDLLVDLGITDDTFAALSLLPLVAVAWADRRVDAKERRAVLEAAADAGIGPADVSYHLLEVRLSEPPDAALLDAWKAYTRILCKHLDERDRALLKGEVLDRATRVAEASGGLLGMGARISRAEQRVLDDLEAAFS